MMKEGLWFHCVNLRQFEFVLFQLNKTYFWFQVQNLIERCLQLYMNQKEVVDTLLEQAKIEPGFTELGSHSNTLFSFHRN